MINKKNLLGKTPDDLGTKDAIHVAIVAVCAAKPIKPGQRCGLNKDRLAVPDEKGCGVADPFLTQGIGTGQTFWFLLNQCEVPNVAHVWEHPTVDFAAPTVTVARNKWLQKVADNYRVSYDELMDACAYVVKHGNPAAYHGPLSADELEDVCNDDVWSEWADETGHEFEDYGSACCPEYAYPDSRLFRIE